LFFQGKIYVYDRVFKANSAQETVYAITAKPIVKGSFLHRSPFITVHYISRITSFRVN